MSNKQLFGGVEAGGTKFICATGDGSGNLRASVEIPTRDPDSTIRALIEFFRSQSSQNGSLAGIGVGSFGPLELDVDATNYGCILATPKRAWRNVDIRGVIAQALEVPVSIETDVNVAALGEWRWGALRGLQHGLYVTIGTGIGVGAIVEGRIFRGEHHPEMGHVYLPVGRDELTDFEGTCPYHRMCVEGLASGTAIVSRWNSKLIELPQSHPAWKLEAWYLAMFLTNLTFTLQPQRIVMGGGVMNDTLLSMVHEMLPDAIGGYRPELATQDVVREYVVSPALAGRAGVLGAIAIAAQ